MAALNAALVTAEQQRLGAITANNNALNARDARIAQLELALGEGRVRIAPVQQQVYGVEGAVAGLYSVINALQKQFK